MAGLYSHDPDPIHSVRSKHKMRNGNDDGHTISVIKLHTTRRPSSSECNPWR
jgi:hypothetical protein